MRILRAKTTVEDIAVVDISNSRKPRYRAVNVDGITVETKLGRQCGSGVLIGEDGRTVQALWLRYLCERARDGRDTEYHLGLATPTLLPVIRQVQQGMKPKLRMLGVELMAVEMSEARSMGVSEGWIKRVTDDISTRHKLFMVRKRTADSGAETGALLDGDLILTLNGKFITWVSELDVIYDDDFLDAVIVRASIEMSIKLPTVSAENLETDRIISFCGAILQRPHLAVRQQIRGLHSEVYVSARTDGSPAYLYKLGPRDFITHVNEKPTPDLSSFLMAVAGICHNTSLSPFSC